MVLPGPEAQQLATSTGWLMHGIPDGLVADRPPLVPAQADRGGGPGGRSGHTPAKLKGRP